MTTALEVVLRLFSPKGALHEPFTGNFSSLGRDDYIGALQVAAKRNPLGLQFLMADHLMDQHATTDLFVHFAHKLGNSEAGTMALAILLRRPMPDQLERCVSFHPHYDKERRRAAIVMEKAKRAHRAGDDNEYQRLLTERNEILEVAHDRCVEEVYRTGRCPHCNGTGSRPRLRDECPKCHGIGRVLPDVELVSRRFGRDMKQALEGAVDEVLHQAADLAKIMEQQVRDMRAA
ncbi:TIGR02642 family protein [Aeromonas enteropelogenes]|uniref:TIGR02642 family protein n=1 Tax=Aeromonas enteropelogenes TaxID=29489 RepID=UPI003134F44C